MALKDRTLEIDKREARLSKDLAVIFGPAYELLGNSLKRVVKNSPQIIDIGCNDGKIEDLIDEIGAGNKVVAVDINDEALKPLKEKEYKSIKVETFCGDGNSFLENSSEKADLLIINSTLHELNTPEDQAGYLDNFFKRLDNILKPNGKIILGDHYYDVNLSDEEVAAYIVEQFKKIKHADARNKFILPELLKQKIQEHGYDILDFNEVRVTPEINKRYYLFVINKRQQEPKS